MSMFYDNPNPNPNPNPKVRGMGAMPSSTKSTLMLTQCSSQGQANVSATASDR
jgi:hypothetical protein